MDFRIERLSGPIIVPNMDARMGTNINGPSLIRAPDWLPTPPGRYLLYFAHHNGTYIRLAFADAIEGPVAHVQKRTPEWRGSVANEFPDWADTEERDR